MSSEPLPFEQVFQAELELLRERRARAGLPLLSLGTVDQPSTQNGLIGLALSGGGIRSATFGLGVLQSLVRARVFLHFDYLSTVSGGGFVGAAVSAALNRAPGAPFPFPSSREGDTPELAHFRANANYLNPGGLLSAGRFPALLLRGLLLNVLALTPWLMLAVLLTDLGYVHLYNTGHLETLSFVPLLLSVPFLVLLVTHPLTAPLAGRGLAFRERYERVFSGALLLLVLGVLMAGVIDAALWAIEIPTEDVWSTLSAHFSGVHLPLIAGGLCMTFVVARFLAPKTMRGFTRAALYLAGALVPLACFGIYLFECMYQIESAFLPETAYIRAKGGLPMCGSGPKSTPKSLCKPLIAREVWQDERSCEASRIECRECDGDKQGCVLYEFSPTDGGEKDLYQLVQNAKGLRSKRLSYQRVLDFNEHGDQLAIGVCVFVFLLYFFALDANAMSLHGFYRDALSRLFLLASRSSGDPKVDLKVSELSPALTGAPYPIINTTINVQGAYEGVMRDRSGAAFSICPLFSGGAVTGYAKTSEIEQADARFCLASAVAISAAAAGPNMGSFTVRSLTLLLTLFNIRLGYWLPNPRQLALGKFSKKPPGPRYIWREALGAVHARGRFVNVSDGGHFENLAAYELLRRKCSLIVVIDGEEDPAHQFNGFVRLLHLARVDLGVVIDADLSEIRQIESGVSPRHFLWANIRYSAAADGTVERGRLLYIKASVTGDEAPGLQAYRARSPRFPHESTADQFFSEVQFEAYRTLGEHVGDETLTESQLLALLGVDAGPRSLRPQRPLGGPAPTPPA